MIESEHKTPLNTSSDKNYACEHCGRIFKKSNKLNRHISETHLGQKKYKCNDCGKEFTRDHHLKRHLLTHSGEKPFKCYYTGCPMSFSCNHHLKRHIQVIHEKKEIICQECKFTTMKKKAFNKHKCLKDQIEVKLEKNPKPKPTKKINKNNKDENVFACTVDSCTKYYSRFWALKQHIRVHHDKEGTKFNCLQCDKSFGHKHTLEKHLIKHEQDKDSSEIFIKSPEIFLKSPSPQNLKKTQLDLSAFKIEQIEE